ncbi:WGxxGxxG-CTERM domain-containing protein [Nodosilinea sp. LEGE 06152]|uniref:WGxxGxxG family protein n=1 Tax=Nodosilinea sp. LEGE 06152 TaxID=2777966 RepID=UPI001881F0F1|nr:WGxxGxxG family protein [Nodosilinea sp. LEGE 06152]MBE9160609.1 WGxxGxxG-CTERM domain-containing protein [Nodosilinea sp. LEGE 06152]
MKSNLASKWVGASALALSLAVLPSALPAAAQTTPEPVNPTLSDDAAPGTVAPDATYSDPNYAVEDNDGFDWGWLGLLGLLGLAGLAGRNKERTTTTYRTDDRVTTPTSTDPRI